eukprot:TRINITY_DN8926_c0_g1_i1.p1 TRINITY_DN8926_c0_g1~~TRINITY_DN8926_c0_g1_i1.p1  ORF type:complete len:301 (+),score=47.20 TRINITY_DN8926_c0_g1_i1:213-1115(+)
MSSTSGLTFKLHPLVIVNISDHFTRIKAQLVGGPAPRVIGCVIGVQSGRNVEIFNSFELKFDAFPDGTIVVDRAFLTQKQEQYKKVFPKNDILGWYSTGSDIHDADMQIHKALMDINESPIYLLLNPAINHAQKDLPISIYESELHVIEGAPSLIFVKSMYTIETVEAERISVDHVAHIKPSDGSSAATQLAAHLTGMHSAIKMLHSRVKVLHHLLTTISKEEAPYEHSLLRQISSLLRRLPTIDSLKFQEEFLMEYNDTLLMTYMATITKGTSTINELVDKFNTAYDKQGRRGGRQSYL